MIKWSDYKAEYDGIKAEHEAELAVLEEGHRERCVRLYREHEGEETDEKVRGKVVKVTAASFARHMGIAERSFQTWVSKSGAAVLAPPNGHSESEESTGCINDGVPPKESLIREVTRRLREALPLLSELSADTHTLIAEDLDDLKALIAEIESNLKERQW